MKNLFLMTMLALTMMGCDRQDDKNTRTSAMDRHDNDNTEKNVRDRNSMTKTPMDQSESEADRMITKTIRQAIVSDDALSTNAKNIKIITVNRVVTLRGPVGSAQEKEAIIRKVQDVQGIQNVDNQLEITRK